MPLPCEQSMETKQKSLLQRVEALDEECEELQKQLGEREERELNLHNQLQQMSEDNEQLRTQFTSQRDTCSQLQSEKQTLQTQIEYFQGSVAELKQSVKSLKETERLLVAFPELSPLAHAQPKSTGNVLLDMEQQLQANSIRIGVLEKENAALQGSLVKLKEAAQQNAAKVRLIKSNWIGTDRTEISTKGFMQGGVASACSGWMDSTVSTRLPLGSTTYRAAKSLGCNSLLPSLLCQIP
uniref:Uncharacterized protein n=1 Tax=Hippocampus comes TaxID=109280 RepID=A0A3Q2ZG98_HIPCM